MEHSLTESAWRRGWNDTKSVWRSWQFYVLNAVVAVVAVVISGIFGWGWGLAVIALGMLCAWIGATTSAPVRQRNEVRKEVERRKDWQVSLKESIYEAIKANPGSSPPEIARHFGLECQGNILPVIMKLFYELNAEGKISALSGPLYANTITSKSTSHKEGSQIGLV